MNTPSGYAAIAIDRLRHVVSHVEHTDRPHVVEIQTDDAKAILRAIDGAMRHEAMLIQHAACHEDHSRRLQLQQAVQDRDELIAQLREERDAYRITLQQISAFANSELRSTPEAIMAANALKTKAAP